MASPGEDVQAWSKTATTNANSDPLINWAEGQPRASVNNSARSMLAAHAKDRDLKNGSITTGGTASAQTFTSGVAYTTVPTGLTVRLKVGVTNTGATTLNMDGIGAVAIKDQAGLDIGANALLLGRYVDLLYNGTNWILLSSSGASAAPFEALAYNGMQINGSMDVSQEKGTANTSLTPGSGALYVVDGFLGVNIGATRSGIAVQQPISTLAGFTNALGLICVTPAALAAGDTQYITQVIEGVRWSRLAFGNAAASPVTIAFWINANVTGTMAVAVRNGAGTRSYVANVTINVATAWEYKTVTIPGDVAGTWVTNNTAGASIAFCFGAGATYQTAANTWTAGNFFATSSTTNFWATASTVYLTGVVVLPGSDAPSAARSPFIMRPYDQELMTCQRYWQKIGGYNLFDALIGAYAPNAGSIVGPLFILPMEMRSAPTLTYVGTWTAANTSAVTATIGPRSLYFNITSTGVGQSYYYNAAGSYISLDARL